MRPFDSPDLRLAQDRPFDSPDFRLAQDRPFDSPDFRLAQGGLDRHTCDRARRSRDARFDGRFFIAVTSTGIYCRPICPARAPKDDHIRYYPTAAAAEAAGFRPCLRCRPEASPGTPAWFGTSGIVSRALRLISEGALDEEGVDRLADRVGVTARHLRRLFLQHLGAAPLDVALTRRVHFAKKLLDETALTISEVAFASGFGSLRRFNGQIRRTFKRTPTELRRLARKSIGADSQCYRFRLAYRPPYDWDAMLAFLRSRATPGVELVDTHRYRRTIQIDGVHGALDVSHLGARSALEVDVRFADSRALLRIVERVRRVFDLGADPVVINEHLGGDPVLGPLLAEHPGIRVPGAWDGFELAVRAILDRAAPVGAMVMAGRLASMFGSPVEYGAGLERLFPTASALATAAIEQAGVSTSRANTIRTLARCVVEGTIAFDGCLDPRAALSSLREVPGIDRWTAEYIAMRAFGEPDAFPAGSADERSNEWRPWRAYAAMLSAFAPARSGGTRHLGGLDHAPSARSTLRDRNARAADLVAAAGAG
jgi:AraC family transcriptional regulator, regulatory protein of adaptative response / DNA-3-methyladenine glycosylase II